ncbi:protein TRANSPORT INHIBITOR RESPONSE 1 [Cucumis melo var. makuwa]|uniref:Protein TRANSPORT INHIBITOR RESPONSE 1 n=1 Tax=Cucumis melo var. makuwa TaxID=1194695 RepID=A0A5A7T431_CUCMM|nr:protein TRANSPORT INHIBITOR RESPONSE 1 [Cucumis melo var. makuwa]
MLMTCKGFNTDGLAAIAANCRSEVSVSALERLVDRCPNLRTLRLNRPIPLDRHANLLRRAPQLVEFGVGCYMADLRSEVLDFIEDSGLKVVADNSLCCLPVSAIVILPNAIAFIGNAIFLLDININIAIMSDFYLAILFKLRDWKLCSNRLWQGGNTAGPGVGAINKQMTAIEEMVASEYN